MNDKNVEAAPKVEVKRKFHTFIYRLQPGDITYGECNLSGFDEGMQKYLNDNWQFHGDPCYVNLNHTLHSIVQCFVKTEIVTSEVIPLLS